MRWLSCLLALCCAPAHALTVQDDAGQTLTLNAPAQKIISLSPSITENLFAIGAGARIVGTSSASDYPLAAQQIPVVADYQNIQLERIAALKPDVVVAWQGGTSPAQLAALAQLNIPVYLHRVQTLSDIPLSLMRLAQLTGLEATAAPQILAAYQSIRLLRDAPQPRLSAFYQVWPSPLTTLNRSNWVSDALARCGAVNLFADAPVAAPTVGMETVLKYNPDIIISATTNADLDAWRNWPNLAAVRRNALWQVDADVMNRATLRTLAASAQLCQQIDGLRHA
ncbi:MAG: cobalamin-binding protein [Formosimonas sp.]